MQVGWGVAAGGSCADGEGALCWVQPCAQAGRLARGALAAFGLHLPLWLCVFAQ